MDSVRGDKAVRRSPNQLQDLPRVLSLWGLTSTHSTSKPIAAHTVRRVIGRVESGKGDSGRPRVERREREGREKEEREGRERPHPPGRILLQTQAHTPSKAS